ncbi:YvcK family protein [Candidatus Peribacteria bacterium]|nr:YvcK family protein [Candidatus Peribacteria bacterium]
MKYAHAFLGYPENQIIPATYDCNDITIETYDGQILTGESHIIQNQTLSKNVRKIFLTPEPKASKESLQAIKYADIIILGPGTLYSSIIASLLPT